jgi:beta-xylosidase
MDSVEGRMNSSTIHWTIVALALPIAPTLGGCDTQSDNGGALPVVWVPANETSAKTAGPDGGVEMSIPFTNNPVLPGYHADPQVALFGNTFYIYPTTDGFLNWTSTSFSVFSSTNLVNWTDRGVILDLPRDLTWAKDQAWAPGIVFKGGTYYLYFAAAQQIGVATSTSPTGPFKDALGRPLIRAGLTRVQSIDPYPFIDDDGTAYLYFGSGGARVVRLNDDMISFTGTSQDITPTGYNEGSVMFKRGGVYYFLWSEHDTRSVTYQVAYGRAPSPLGPFIRVGVILQEDPALGILATGHNSVLSIPGRDEHYMVYHRFAIPDGDGYHREVCIDPMYFNADGTIVPVKPTVRGLQAAVVP